MTWASESWSSASACCISALRWDSCWASWSARSRLSLLISSPSRARSRSCSSLPLNSSVALKPLLKLSRRPLSAVGSRGCTCLASVVLVDIPNLSSKLRWSSRNGQSWLDFDRRSSSSRALMRSCSSASRAAAARMARLVSSSSAAEACRCPPRGDRAALRREWSARPRSTSSSSDEIASMSATESVWPLGMNVLAGSSSLASTRARCSEC
mmetsp:Transcript_17379/g.55374  ORF Transcript_17379/g.55374 Transcript_17379/m.55374 type:complete len:211 (+) Transcript_17379:2293-2925(+)